MFATSFTFKTYNSEEFQLEHMYDKTNLLLLLTVACVETIPARPYHPDRTLALNIYFSLCCHYW